MIACAITAIGCGLVSTWGPHTGLGKLIGYQILLGTRGAGIQMASVLHASEIKWTTTDTILIGNRSHSGHSIT